MPGLRHEGLARGSRRAQRQKSKFLSVLQIHQAAGLPEDLFSLLYLAALGGLENVEALTNVDLETNGIHGHVAHWYAGKVDDAALLAQIERHSGVEGERARAVVHLHLGARAERVGELAEARAAYQTAADTGVDTIGRHVAGQALVRLSR